MRMLRNNVEVLKDLMVTDWKPVRWTTFLHRLTNEGFEEYGNLSATPKTLAKHFVEHFDAAERGIYVTVFTFNVEIEEDDINYRAVLKRLGVGIVKYYQFKTNRWKYKPILIGSTEDWIHLDGYRMRMFSQDG